jgi:hypothetical protein
VEVGDRLSSKIMADEDECRFRGLNLRVSDSAMFHLCDFDISIYTLCDMVRDSFDCPKSKRTGKPFRKTSVRICAMHKGRIYNIIMDQMTIETNEYWSVSHLEPI